MKRLTTEQILMLHSQLIMTTGGLDGVRDKGLVDSSLSSAFEVYFGVERYPTIEEKAARLCYSLIKNLYQKFLASTGVSTDTRNIAKGSIYFARKGASFNGNTFGEACSQQWLWL